MEKLPYTYIQALNTLIELYNIYQRPVKSKEIAEKLNINEGTIRNAMIALRAMGFIESKTGPYGGYVPTQKALTLMKIPQTPLSLDLAPVTVNNLPSGLYVTRIELLDILNPLANKAIVRVLGNMKSVRVGDTIRIGPTINSRVIIEGIVVDKNDARGELTITINKLIAIPKVRVGDVMSRNIIYVHYRAPLRDVAKIFSERRIRALPVLDDGDRIIGLITSSDLARACYEGNTNAEVHEYMRKEVPIINAEHDIFDAIKLMSIHGIGRLIVIDSVGKPIGIITRTDILKFLAMLDEFNIR